MNNFTPTRIQFACNGILIAECIIMADAFEESNFCARFWQERAKNNKPIGSAMMSNIEVPRYWDVKVGEKIKTVSIGEFFGL